MKILKDLYSDYFKLGCACERVTEKFTSHEIGNAEKEKLILQQFNSITCANELKPAYNMGFADPSATEEYLPFVIQPKALEMLNWAKTNNISMRGHVLVWHSQCADEAFCKEYKPVREQGDPEKLKENPFMARFLKLDPVCFVSRETMIKRLKSYIFSLMEYMFANGFAKTLYAWDVVNEAIEPEDKTPTGLRNSYWYRVIGEDFMYFAFLYAKQAVQEMSVKYARNYGIDPEDKEAIKTIQPKLFYNDYNEFFPEKKEAIIAALTRETEEHGSIIGDGLIDGIGMQGHISDNNNIDQYIDALMEYSKLVDEVHITELDVKCTCTNKNAEYYQAVFYKEFFSRLIQAKNDGAKLTSVTFWGLTDENSWIRGANPLLFHGELEPKKAFDALVYAVEGGDLGEPEKIEINLSDRKIDFESMGGIEQADIEALGFKMRGFGRFAITDKECHCGTHCLANEHRFGAYSNISFDISDFIGQTITFSAWVKSSAKAVTLNGEGVEKIAVADTSCGDWVQIRTTFKVPRDVHSYFFVFGTEEDTPDKFNGYYVDDVEIELNGLEESFEEKTNIAAIRGAGHLPFCYVTDTEAHTPGGHSYCVTRQEKDATIKLDISSYIGMKVEFTAYVKTADKKLRLGLDGAEPLQLLEIDTNSGWNELKTDIDLSENITSAEIYLETDGNAVFYVDDIFVRPIK